MKFSLFLLLIVPFLSFAQPDKKRMVDSLLFVTDMPYVCRDTQITDISLLSVGCGDKIFWKVVKQKQEIIPFLIDKLDDTTSTYADVPNVGGQYTVADIAYVALEEIIKGIPTFELLGVKFDEDGCGYCSYWYYLRERMENRKGFQVKVRSWYEVNKSKLIWVQSSDVLTCDCLLAHPNGGHFEVKE